MSTDVSMRSVAPASAEILLVDGLAVTRRVRPDADPSRPVVILIHGAMDRAASFGRVMRRLPELETITYDRRGYGGSNGAPLAARGSLVGSGTIASHGEDLRTVMHHALESSPTPGRVRESVLVGHSLGGIVALWLASRNDPDVVGVGAFESPAPWLDDSFDTVGGGALDIAERQGDSEAGEYFYRMMIGEETFSRLRERDVAARRSEGHALVGELRSLRDPAQAFDLSTVKVPVVVGSGTASSQRMQGSARLMASAIPGAVEVRITDSGHGAHLTRPEAFANYVRECVSQAATHVAG